ncbi:MAG TPA: DUF1330 domain-containing protein [Vicinamibacterales bacterium]|jgi:uncharacterized protein (DUF1330 family)
MPAYVVVNIEVHDPERYKDYIKMSPGSIAQYGGRFIARGGRTEALEGTTQARRVVVLEFPSYEQARAWHVSAEYADAKKLRQSIATTSMLLVEGVAS